MLRTIIFCALLSTGAIAQLLPEASGEGPSPFEEEASGSSIDGSGVEPAEIPADPQECPPKLDVVFLLDTSGSIKGIYQEHVRWTVALVDTLPVDKDSVRVAAVQYAGFPLTEFALGTYPKGQDIREHLEKMEFRSGVTRTGDALKRAETELFRVDRGGRSDAAKVIVLFTDGLSIDDPLRPAIELRNVMSVKIYVVGLSAEGFMPEMDAIAGSKQRVFGPNDLTRLRTALLRDVDEARKCSRQGNQSKPPAAPKQPEKQQPILQPIDEDGNNNLLELEHEHYYSTTGAPNSTTAAAAVTELSNNVKSSENSSVASVTTLSGKESNTIEDQGNSSAIESKTTAAPKQTLETSTRLAALLITGRPVVEAARPQHFERLIVDPFAGNDLDDNEIVENATPKTPARTPVHQTTTARTINLDEEEPEVTEDPETQAKLNARGRGSLPKGSCPLDILFILDSSGSVQNVYDDQKSFIRSVLDEVDMNDRDHRVALVQFAGDELQKTEWSFDTYADKDRLMNAFHEVRHFTGTTYIGSALTHARELLDSRRQNIRTLVLLVSDGYSQDDAEKVAKAIRQTGRLKMYAVSLAKLNYVEYLTELVGGRENVFVGPQEVDSLKRILHSEMACQRRI